MITPEIRTFINQQRLLQLQKEAKELTVSNFSTFHFSVIANDDVFSVEITGNRIKNVCALADIISQNVKLKELLKDALILAEK